MSTEQKSPSQVERNQIDFADAGLSTNIVHIGRWTHKMGNFSKTTLKVKKPSLWYACRLCGVSGDMRTHKCPPIIKNRS